MRKVEINLADAKPRLLTPERAAGAHMLITMGCGEACPVAPGARRADWPLLAPQGRPIEGVHAVRDEIRERVQKLIASEGWDEPKQVSSSRAFIREAGHRLSSFTARDKAESNQYILNLTRS
jgi:arsenate reductase (thioredoxin)